MGLSFAPLNTLTGWEFLRASSCREGMRTSFANCSHRWNSGHTLDMRITAGKEIQSPQARKYNFHSGGNIIFTVEKIYFAVLKVWTDLSTA